MRTSMFRRPRWIYGSGADPDYRFSLANERTFLAWIRTSLALLAASVGLSLIDLEGPRWAQQVAGDLLVLLALVGAVVAWLRWALAEREMRAARSLPSFAGAAGGFALGVAVAGAAIMVALG
ncbi:YidH family protein [Nocardioides sp. NPDC101246]|uniref:YidH family protein n=1 Tax=Nocardioides sp. NPDC101246 TaxID=3364336 RepID=UPI0037FF742A